MSDLSREADAIIEAASGADEPTGADRDRVRSALFAQLGIGGGIAGAAGSAQAATTSAPAAGSTAVAAAKSTILFKLIGGMVLVGALSVGGYFALRGDSSPAPQAAPASATEPATSAESVVEPAVDVETQPAAEEEPEAADADPVIEIDPEPVERSRKRAAAPAPASLESLRAEKALIDGARRKLAAGDHAGALAQLAVHARQFRRGQLAAERAGTRVLALCAAGDVDAASAEAARFLKKHPSHPMAARVRASCAR